MTADEAKAFGIVDDILTEAAGAGEEDEEVSRRVRRNAQSQCVRRTESHSTTHRHIMPLIPYVIEKSGREERAMDIYSRLLKDRIVLLGSAVNDDVANAIVAQLLFLQSDDPKADIHLYINSPGGSVTAGMAIYDTMQFVTCDVATYCIGQCASMGAVLLTAGAEGKRHALPNARIMIHQPSGRHGRHGRGHPDSRQGVQADQGAAEPHPVQAHRPARSSRSRRTPTATTSCRPRKPSNTG